MVKDKKAIDAALETQQAALTEKEAATYIGFSRSYLRQSRSHGKRKGRTDAPPYIRVGGRTIRYLRTDLDEWLQERRVDQVECQP